MRSRRTHPTQRFRAAAMAILALYLMVLVLLSSLFMPSTAEAQVPRTAVQHRLQLTREARAVWGLYAPVPAFAAQIHQESLWRPDARSPVGALGLTQFMPATADWIGSLDPQLAARTPLNPAWSIRALVVYDRWLWDRIRADDDCEHMAYSLSAYNGGLKWVQRRQKASPTPGVCLGATCALNPGITAANQRENERYPRVILLQHQPLYRAWGPMLCV